MNEEVIRNIARMVYLGEPAFSPTQLTSTSPQRVAMADTIRICKLYEGDHRSDEVGLDNYGPEHVLPGNDS